MAAAYDAGVNFFDNAEVYASGKSEEVMGDALKKLKWRRGQLSGFHQNSSGVCMMVSTNATRSIANV